MGKQLPVAAVLAPVLDLKVPNVHSHVGGAQECLKLHMGVFYLCAIGYNTLVHLGKRLFGVLFSIVSSFLFVR